MTEDQKKNVKLWIEALRSGKYKQTRGCLRAEGAYCCLGVACDLYQKVGPGNLNAREAGEVYLYNNMEDVLPDEVQDWLGLASPQGTYGTYLTCGSAVRCLSADNDNGTPFSSIASLIEAHLALDSSPMFVHEGSSNDNP